MFTIGWSFPYENSGQPKETAALRGSQDKIDAGGASGYERCLIQLEALCRALERLADALPSRVDTRGAELLAQTLQQALRTCHQVEADVVFPVLLNTHPEMGATIARLRAEHVEDEDQACEVTDAILTFVIVPKRKDVEELGYLLRCLFVSLRRHLAFDRDYVLPLYRRTTTQAAIKPLPQPPAH